MALPQASVYLLLATISISSPLPRFNTIQLVPRSSLTIFSLDFNEEISILEAGLRIANACSLGR